MPCVLISFILALSPAIFVNHKGEVYRADLEKILGKPIRTQGAQLATYRSDDAQIEVEFTHQDVVKRLRIYAVCPALTELTEKFDRIVPQSRRGKYLRRKGSNEPYRCRTQYVDEYENVIISYGEDNCMNCNHPEIKVEWRHVDRTPSRPSNTR